MGFGETGQQKEVVLIDFSEGERNIIELAVPLFQPLERISGTVEAITSRIFHLKAEGSTAWLEIEYTGAELPGNLRELLEEAVKGSLLEIRRIKNNRLATLMLQQFSEHESLDELGEFDVFERCLNAAKVPEAQRPALVQAYQEIVLSIHEDDEPLDTSTSLQMQLL